MSLLSCWPSLPRPSLNGKNGKDWLTMLLLWSLSDKHIALFQVSLRYACSHLWHYLHLHYRQLNPMPSVLTAIQTILLWPASGGESLKEFTIPGKMADHASTPVMHSVSRAPRRSWCQSWYQRQQLRPFQAEKQDEASWLRALWLCSPYQL